MLEYPHKPIVHAYSSSKRQLFSLDFFGLSLQSRNRPWCIWDPVSPGPVLQNWSFTGEDTEQVPQTDSSCGTASRGAHGHRRAALAVHSLEALFWGTGDWSPRKGPLGVSQERLVKEMKVDPSALTPVPVLGLLSVVVVVRRAHAFKGGAVM